MRHCRALVALEIALAASSGGFAQEELRIQLVDGRPLVSGVRVDGAGPFRFLLDTGSQSNAISNRLANKLGWQPNFRVELVTITGTTYRSVYSRARVDLGPRNAENQEFLITPDEDIRKTSVWADGVLGQAFLRRLDYVLDFRRQRLTFEPEQVLGGVKVPFHLSHGRMVARTNRGLLVIDSGANVVVLRRGSSLRTRDQARLLTSSGESGVKMESVDLRIGEQEYRAVTAAVVPAGDTEPGEPDGLLPVSLFDSLYVSNSGGYVVIEPRGWD